MKKWVLISAVPTSVATVATAVIVPATMTILNKDYSATNKDRQNEFNEIQKASKIPFVKYDLNKNDNLINSLNSADINLFYNGAGAITTVYMQQLALLAAAGDTVHSGSKEVHYALAPDTWEPQAKVNQEEFLRILHLGNSNSSLLNVHSDSRGRIVDKWVEIIKANPDKKINVWWNSDHLHHENGSPTTSILDLAAFKNVNIQLLEDGASIGTSISSVMTPENLVALKSNKLSINTSTQYLLPSLFENVRSWFTSQIMQNLASSFDFLGGFAAKDLPEALFNTRINDNAVSTRLFTYWTKVSGNDWHDALKIMQMAAQEFPGKKNMLILGSYGADREEEYIQYLYNKYHNGYNIFYKGHPGHMEHTNFINNELISSKKYTGIYTFEPSIASEELTRDHFKDGIKFDKLAVVGKTSALFGFPDYDMNELFTDAYVPVIGKETVAKEFVAKEDQEWTSEVGTWLIQ